MGNRRQRSHLKTIWTKFEEHCKCQANELHTHYDLLKQFKQGDKSCDKHYTLLQNQLALCQYPPKTQNILEQDVFLFGNSDQAFMSKCICQRLKKLGSRRATICIKCHDTRHKSRFTCPESRCQCKNVKSMEIL